jgi:hypothetical protein
MSLRVRAVDRIIVGGTAWRPVDTQNVRRGCYRLISERRGIPVKSLLRLSQLLFVSPLVGPPMLSCAVLMAGWMAKRQVRLSELHNDLLVYLAIQQVYELPH